MPVLDGRTGGIPKLGNFGKGLHSSQMKREKALFQLNVLTVLDVMTGTVAAILSQEEKSLRTKSIC